MKLQSRAVAVVSQCTSLVSRYWGVCSSHQFWGDAVIQRAAEMIKARTGFMRQD